ncbi:hypothetical protein GF367_00720 [Candidatus Woesearchaeota archaeon]|nr:hypothetical protein [Candidatus Woesearchaeota archaeon]
MRFGELAEKHLSVLILPAVIILYSLVRVWTATEDFVAMAFSAWVWVSLLALGLAGIFLVLNWYWFRMRMKWWGNFLVSVGLILLSLGILLAAARIQ